jgi:hypothetical protein
MEKDTHTKKDTMHIYATAACAIGSCIAGGIVGHDVGKRMEQHVLSEGYDQDQANLAYGITYLGVFLGTVGTGLLIGALIDDQINSGWGKISIMPGFEWSPLAVGPTVIISSERVLADFSYGLGKHNKSNAELIEIDNSYRFDLSLSLVRNSNPQILKPFVGVGLFTANENSTVSGLSGCGQIKGYRIIAGLRAADPWYRDVGANIKMSYSFWDYSNSILSKMKSPILYNYPKLGFSLQIYLIL